MWKNKPLFTDCIPHFCGKLFDPAKRQETPVCAAGPKRDDLTKRPVAAGNEHTVKTLTYKEQKAAICWQTPPAYVILQDE